MRYINRRYFGIIVFIITLVLIAPTAAWAAEEQLSIDNALKLAQTTNPQITSLALQVDRAQILRDNAAEGISFYPTGQLLVSPTGQVLVNNYEQTTVQLATLKKQLESEKKRVEKEVISAYATALISSYDMQATRLMIEDMEKQAKTNQLAVQLGVISNYDNSKYNLKVEQLRDSLTIQQEQYNAAIAVLRGLLHKGSDWKPVLTSQAAITKYPRQSIDTEFIRATSESVLILGAEVARDLERIKIYWPAFDGEDRYMDRINLNVKELEYEKSKRDLWSTVEQLYHGTDALERQIELTEKVLAEKEKDLSIMELKYKLGLISLRSLQPGQDTLEATRISVEKAKLDLNSLHARMASNKANYAYITGQTVYSPLDWK